MAIPEFNDDGFLPPGIFPCNLEEIEANFGRFKGTDRRSNLTEKLKEYVNELKSAKIAKSLIIDGSYITAIDQPNDIDILLILKDDVDLTKTFPPFIKNTFNGKYIRKHYHLDFYFGFEGDKSSTEIISLFKKIKEQPGKEKGYLKIDFDVIE